MLAERAGVRPQIQPAYVSVVRGGEGVELALACFARQPAGGVHGQARGTMLCVLCRLRTEPNNYYRLQRVVDILLQSGGKPLAGVPLHQTSSCPAVVACTAAQNPP